MGNAAGKADALQALAQIRIHLKDYENSFSLLEDALKVAEEAQLADNIIFIRIKAAIAKMANSENKAAEAILLEALAKIDSLDGSRFRPIVLGHLGQAYLGLKEYEKSQRYLRSIIAMPCC
ncbi:MAG: hypothetical protein R2795_25995 [Saprospiraceae bacterium]